MNAEKQYKESQKVNLIQSKWKRSRLSFVDNRPQSVSQASLVELVQKKENKKDVTQLTKKVGNEIVSSFLPNVILGRSQEEKGLLTKTILKTGHVMLTLEWYDEDSSDHLGQFTQHLTYNPENNPENKAFIKRKEHVSRGKEVEIAYKKRRFLDGKLYVARPIAELISGEAYFSINQKIFEKDQICTDFLKSLKIEDSNIIEEIIDRVNRYIEGADFALLGIGELAPDNAFSFSLLRITNRQPTIETKELLPADRRRILDLLNSENDKVYTYVQENAEGRDKFTCLTWADKIWNTVSGESKVLDNSSPYNP